jgi:hypothetical protein
MISIDCPLCTGEAQVEGRLDAVTCEGCGVTIEIAPDPADVLDLAA